MSKILKFGIIILFIVCLLLLAVTLVDIPALVESLGLFTPDGSTPEPETGNPDLSSAVANELQVASTDWQDQNYQIDHIEVQDDGLAAAIWLSPTDPETGEFLGREPSLAIAELDANGNWQVFLDGTPGFDEAFTKFQYAEKSVEGDLTCEGQPKSGVVYGGYYLPWAEGLTKRLTWSVSHTSCYPIYYCTHAFDYADGSMFPLVAAKGGTVYHWKDTCANGDSNCTNSITLQDRSTTPWTYQIYMHIAYNSVPDNLKKVGAAVMQGQYIADVDDTGYSTGHHVHFMVVSEQTKYLSTKGYIFGMAEDITYRDVTINWDAATQGGRPRLAYEAEDYGGEGQTYYTSGNAPANPPTGGLTTPEMKTYITDPVLTVTGWGKDDVAVTKYEILARVDSEWLTIKEVNSGNNFTTTVNLCDTDLPDGPLELALRVWDYEGNPSSVSTIRKLVKNTVCEGAGKDPTVELTRLSGKLILPSSGLVTAEVVTGNTGSAITSVEFWLIANNWYQNDWVNLGLDTDGSNGWQAPINTASLAQGTKYTVLAVATDQAGNQGIDAEFNAVVDKTSPWLKVTPLPTPNVGQDYSIQWRASDSIAGLMKFDLAVRINDGDWKMVDSYISPWVRRFDCHIPGEGYIEFRLRAYDSVGNVTSAQVATATSGYENNYSFPLFNN